MSLLKHIMAAALAVLSISSGALYARPDSTVATVIQIRADSIRTDGWYDGTATTRISKAFIEKLSPATVTDVLAVVPGVYIRDYGGVGGMRTVSIRGGSSSQSLILINGVRLTSAQNGAIDLSLFPASMLDGITVRRGGASALYGANALTGVVDIHLDPPASSGLRGLVEYGSFLTEHFMLQGRSAGDKVSVQGIVDVRNSNGGYPVTTSQYGREYEINRQNSDLHSVSSALQLNAGNSFSAMVIGRTSHRGVPGAVVQGNVAQTRATMTEDDVLGTLKYISKLDDWDVSASLAMRVFDQHYVDAEATLFGTAGLDERFLLRDGSLNIMALRVTELSSLTAALEVGWTDLRGARLQPDVGDPIIRRTASARVSYSNTLVADTNDNTVLGVQGALRGDSYTQFGTTLSPLVTVRWLAARDVMTRASWGYNFRPPTFNELYYLNYGTADLKAERSHSYNIGATYKKPSYSIDIDVFTQLTSNLIVAIPISPILVSARNVGDAQTYGLEISTTAMLFNEHLLGWYSYTLQNAVDRTGRKGLDGTAIPYIPNEVLQLGASYQYSAWTASLQWQYTSYRYTQAGSEISSLLPSYGTVRGALGTTGKVGGMAATFEIVIDNILDSQYYIVKGYPMPGRSFRTNVQLRWDAL